MELITNLFSDFFDKANITNHRLAQFSLDHIQRITSNNPGAVFTTLITDTTTATDAMGSALSLQGGTIGDQKASTIDKNQAREDFNTYIRQQEGTIKGKFGEKSTPYIRFFPNGLTPFGKATDLEYRLLVKNIVDRATQYVADLGAAFLADVIALANAYDTAENIQTTEKGDVSNAKDTLTTERTDLTKQLTINALTIALHFVLQPEKASIYFNTSLLFAAKRKHIAKGKPAAGATEKVHDIKVYEAGKKLHMKNKGAFVLSFQFWLNGAPVGNFFTVNPGTEVDKTFADFFSNGDALYVTNHGTGIGEYEVDEIA